MPLRYALDVSRWLCSCLRVLVAVASLFAPSLGAQQLSPRVEKLRTQAEQGDRSAQSILGLMYYLGQGVPQDYAEAAAWYRKAAEQGDADAQFDLGYMYNNGEGVPQDHAEAIKWFRKAAEQGDASAQFDLGYMYNNGEGVPQDYAEVVKWFLLAAEQGYASAQFNLGVMYHQGEGVPQDYLQAHKWFDLAASRSSGQDGEKFRKTRDRLAGTMTPEQIAEAQRLAREWKPKTWEELKALGLDK